METEQSNPNRTIYALLALMVIVCAAGVWFARKNMSRAIYPPPTATETGKSLSQPAQGGATPEPASARSGATSTPTEFIPIIVIQVDQADVRSGPNPIFPLLIQVKRGLALRAVGRNAENTHLLVLLPDNRQGWIPVMAAAFDFDLELLPIVAAPSTPTFTPTPSPTPAPGFGATPIPTGGAKPYGQGNLAPPQIPGIAPGSPGSPGRRALGLVSATLLSLLALSRRGWTIGLLRPVMARMAQMLSALL